ncbi:DUF1287 domain-containing protein [Moheibacter sediminis]|uniref:DUF1287 domain-containing protein n=1 Tax=Moheibacter sediminis TaxID=1434700 RepID=A0A1W2BDF1_9FLAO|nr:DUF1287 domain-containing protein [Moheibacter sediminis]SMC70995.1 hypothetical protein SAMN06296427_10689 [Moheibacter sediminis]
MKKVFVLGVIAVGLISCKLEVTSHDSYNEAEIKTLAKSAEIPQQETNLTPKQKKISDAALSIVDPSIDYDPAYFSIDYPNGDVPADKGVCTDVVIRTYRKLGVDLQQLVHEDMKANFNLYPKTWGLSKPDTNIDHRRVPNLMVYFSRFGQEKPMTDYADDYLPGDIVCWRLINGMTHIGMVVDKKSKDGKRFKIVHNIGGGQVLEDVLFHYEIIGHYGFEEF